MPGLVGFVSSLPHERCIKNLETMHQSIQHESFYSSGVYSSKKMHTYIGWTSHPHSFSDCMPIKNEKGNVVLFMAGEVFSDSEMIEGIQQKGHDFNKDNASYLAHLYEEHGEDFVKILNGQFSGVVLDQKRHNTFLFNDRFGLHRIYTFQNNDGFYFSSEAKALLALFPEIREFDTRGVCELLTCGCTFGETSLYKNINVLQGGTIVKFGNGKYLGENRYFDRSEWEKQSALSKNEFYDQYIDKINTTVGRYIKPTGKVGISLTGGVDSRLVIGSDTITPDSLPCYTFGNTRRETFDVKIGRKVARKCKQSHTVINIEKDFMDGITGYLEKAVKLSDGYLGIDGAVELYANRRARSIAPVRLTGNYGSELLRGVRFFKYKAPRGNILKSEVDPILKDVKNSFIKINENSNNLSFIVFYQAPFQGFGRLAIERSQMDMRTPFLDNDLLSLHYQAPDSIDGFDISKAIIKSIKPELLTLPTDGGYWGSGGALIRRIRRFSRNASFKFEYLVGRGSPGWYLKWANLLKFFGSERMFIGTHKFHDVRLLIRDHLTEYIKDMLLANSNSSLYKIIDRQNVEKLVNDHIKQKHNYGAEIDRLLTLAIAEKLFFK